MFVIEDELHAETQGEYRNVEEAILELRRRSEVPWDSDPNQAPCMSWRTCGREYMIIEYDDSHSPHKQIQRILALQISSKGIVWHIDPKARQITLL